ncbi:hypothetical protein LTR85_008289 [Meristemomyces frigidus]|nr:hypothetical protein LTR85_008289 [Meristemomyces frigidus]
MLTPGHSGEPAVTGTRLAHRTGSVGLGFLINRARQTLVHRLERSIPEKPANGLPDEMVMLILEQMMIQPQQPVRIQSWGQIVEDPSTEKCSLYFHGCKIGERLLAMAREAYFRANTLRIDAPVERSPRQILRSEKFTMPWASDIYSLELVSTPTPEQNVPRPYPSGVAGPRPRTRSVIEQRDITRVLALLSSLKQPFPNLRRLTLMLTIESPRDDESDHCHWGTTRRLSRSGRLCCVLLDETLGFVDAYLEDIAPALREMDVNYAAFKWRTSCGHVQYREWFGEDLEAADSVVRMVDGAAHKTAVLRDKRMPSWA